MPASPSEITANQSRTGLPGFSAAGLAGFLPAPSGTYQTYRQISAHPTAALVRGIIFAPIIANTWRFQKSSPEIPEDWLSFASSVLMPLRQPIVAAALRALEFGWAGFEKIWDICDGYRIIRRLKPLLWDCTEILVDSHGNPSGLKNSPPGTAPITLAAGKYFLYSFDGEAGNPYGRSRHENIRQAWSESEQIRQRLAQYLKKVAGIVVQLHYPEGTSRDAAGAERPNQWLGQQVIDAVSAGRSVMFPNGFAGATGPQAFDLAGKSSWQISTLETSGADHAPGMKLVLDYYDALIFRGWLRPERVGLESQHGSRADAQTHTDSAMLDCEMIDRDLAAAVQRDILDELMTLNFGQSARGSIQLHPAPLEPDSLGILRDTLKAMLTRPDLPPVDANALLDQLDVPRQKS